MSKKKILRGLIAGILLFLILCLLLDHINLPAYQGGIVTIEALNGNDYHKLEVEY